MSFQGYRLGRSRRIDVYYDDELGTLVVREQGRVLARLKDRAALARGLTLEHEPRAEIKLGEAEPLERLSLKFDGKELEPLSTAGAARTRAGGGLVLLAVLLIGFTGVTFGLNPQAVDWTGALTAAIEAVIYAVTGVLTIVRNSTRAAWIGLGTLALVVLLEGGAAVLGGSFSLGAMLIRFVVFASGVKALSER